MPYPDSHIIDLTIYGALFYVYLFKIQVQTLFSGICFSLYSFLLQEQAQDTARQSVVMSLCVSLDFNMSYFCSIIVLIYEKMLCTWETVFYILHNVPYMELVLHWFPMNREGTYVSRVRMKKHGFWSLSWGPMSDSCFQTFSFPPVERRSLSTVNNLRNDNLWFISISVRAENQHRKNI